MVIPYRNFGDDDHREWIKMWVLMRWAALMPDAEVVLGADGGNGLFNRSRAINDGVAKASGDILVIADADTVFHLHWLNQAIDLCLRGHWVLPYGTYINLDHVASAQILARPPATTIDVNAVTWDHRLTDSVSGLVVTTPTQFAAGGGFDPRFEGWGYEDRAFQCAMDRLVGRHVRVEEGIVFHLWHPVTEGFGSAHIPYSRGLAERYRMATTPAQMRQIVAEHSGASA